MITNITLENFKCFRQVSINPKRLTVLIGPNGTGKSSVLQALLLLKQSVGGIFPSYTGEFFNLRSASELFPNFLADAAVKFHLEAQTREEKVIFSRFLSRDLAPIRTGEEHGSPVELIAILSQMKYVPSMRGFVKPTHDLGNEYKEQLTLQNGLDSYVGQMATNLGYSRSMEESISSLLKKVTGTGLRAEMVPPRSVEVKSLALSGPVNLLFEGFGANALILLLHQLIALPKGATILIEEPEIHLHPKAQADLAEVLAETAKAEDKQIIMTTHSEHIAGRLLTLVAEGKLTVDDLAIYSFEKDGKGECSATELVVTELGQTEGGLTGFFDNNVAEMDRYVKALQNRS